MECAYIHVCQSLSVDTYLHIKGEKIGLFGTQDAVEKYFGGRHVGSG